MSWAWFSRIDKRRHLFRQPRCPVHGLTRERGSFDPPGIRWTVLDLSGPYRLAYDEVLRHAGQLGDPFHVIPPRQRPSF